MGGGEDGGKDRRGEVLLGPHQALCHSFARPEGGPRVSGREGEAWSRTDLLEMLVWLWPEAHLPRQEVGGHKPGRYLTWKAALGRKRTSATANIDPTLGLTLTLPPPIAGACP